MGPAAPGSRLDRLAEGQALLRQLRGVLTIREIAEQIGLNPRTVADWSRGKRPPSAVYLERLRALREAT
jgi:transcriptional regulator with XRE-family HTH domain